MNAAGTYIPKIGEGILSARDISIIAKIPLPRTKSLIKTWNGTVAKKASVPSYFFKGKKVSVGNFSLLIELIVYQKLLELGLEKNRILRTRNFLKKQLGSQYPLAEHKLLANEGEIIALIEPHLGLETNGSNKLVLIKVIQDFFTKIDFHNNKAIRYWPLGKKKSIVVNPEIQFGEPVIFGTRVTAESVYNMYTGGETIEGLINLFDLRKNQIKDAIEFGELAYAKN